MNLLPATTPYSRNHIHHCGAVTLLSSLDQSTLDLIVTDPPYGKNYEAACEVTNGGKPRRAAAKFGEDKFNPDWLGPAYNALKDNSAMYLFTQWDVMHLWREAVLEAGFKFSMLIIWDKMHWGAGNLNIYGCQTECIMFLTKGSHKLNGKRSGNIWRLTKLDVINYEGNYDHPTQKPVRLLQRAIMRSSQIGDVICDPFVGSGSTAEAARQLGRDYLAGDISKRYVDMSRQRMTKDFQPQLLAM